MSPYGGILPAVHAAGMGSGKGAAVTYSLSGQVTDGASGVDGVTVTLGAYSAVSAADGTFSITGIAAGASGSLTPTKTNFTFTPATIAISSMSANLTGKDFAQYYPSMETGLYQWFDAGDITTLFQDSAKTTPVTTNGDPVGAFADKSGNGLDDTQATAESRPVYATNFQNSLPCINLNGSKFLNFPTISLPKQNFSAFFVTYNPSVSSFTALASFGTGVLGILINTGAAYVPYVSGTYANFATVPTTFHSLELTTTAVGRVRYKVNGLRRYYGNVLASATITGGMLGKYNTGFYNNGAFGERLVFTPALSQIAADRVIKYLHAKWGITLPAPTK